VSGAFTLSVLQGSVSILAARLTAPATYPVFAPQSHSLPIITGLKSKLEGKLLKNILRLESLRSGIDDLPLICPFSDKLFDVPARTTSISPPNGTFRILTESTIPIARTTYPLSWNEAAKVISETSLPKVLVCGTKGAGKSTFAQFLTNSLLSNGGNVTYLEADPGQPSFSPPGLVALHSLATPLLSPPFIRTGLPDLIRAQHIGNISPRDAPRHYINCIKDLTLHIPEEAPLIINTPGWTKGTGLELLTSLIEVIQPTFLVVITVGGNDSLATSLQPVTSDSHSNLLVIESANSLSPLMSLTAADLRTLGIMSYFHSTGNNTWDFSTHLTAWKPWVVPFTGSNGGIWAVTIQGEDLLLEDIVLAINGTMTAIILVDEDSEEKVDLTSEGISVVIEREAKFMDPKSSRCVGYAIIRGIDVKKGVMYLLTPWDPETAQEGDRVILERGRVNLPIWGMWDRQNRRIGPWLQKT
jgi:polynucleotide 5'-hydroxyl-kinase GRC3/NOL9